MKIAGHTNHIRVLVVDDDKRCQDMFSTMLSLDHLNTVPAADAETAIELLHKEDFDAVIADLMLPGMNRIDLLKYIRNNHDNLPVILITGYSSIDSAVDTLQHGARDYMVKPPADSTALTIAIKKAVEHSNASNISIMLTGENGNGKITVEDDGAGILNTNESSNGMGIHIMKYRANMVEVDLNINQVDNNGTKVTCSWKNKQ